MIGERAPESGSRLEVSNLTIEVRRDDRWRVAVNDVSFVLGAGERVALVGESGSGKSLTALSLVGLLPAGARVTRGSVRLDGVDLMSVDEKALRLFRGRKVGFVFQNPMASLDPVVRVGDQVQEALRAQRRGSSQERAAAAVEMLEHVGIPEAKPRARNYPHQFSGGMQQRAMIAGALAGDPSILIADEPTTALDVTVQARILSLLRSLSADRNLSLLMITHDLAVASQIADRVVVMYAGRVLEDAPMTTVIRASHHPYTRALLGLVPNMQEPAELPSAIPGHPVPGWEAGPGCPFISRCAHSRDICRTPWRLELVAPNHLSACVRTPASRDNDLVSDGSAHA